ncbi:hypothetical protein L1D53_25360, partial [Vibrio alginolyticus]|nr:hypothetical protein [Vibrio alginolyticus]
NTTLNRYILTQNLLDPNFPALTYCFICCPHIGINPQFYDLFWICLTLATTQFLVQTIGLCFYFYRIFKKIIVQFGDFV